MHTILSDMARYVILHHILPNGESHFDWLLERPSDEGGSLTSFRCNQQPIFSDFGPFHAQSMPDHRREYLDFEGPVSFGRGEVRRVESGIVDKLSFATSGINITLRTLPDTSHAYSLQGVPGPNGSYIFHRTRAQATDPQSRA